MDIIKSIGKLFKEAKTKILNVGKPPGEKVDYNKITQREVPKESAEHEKGVEFTRDTATPLPKMAAKKEPVEKDPVSKKPAVTKTTTVKIEAGKKQATSKKSASKTTSTKTKPAKKPVNKKPAAKKSEVKTSTTKKDAPKKAAEKKTTSDNKTVAAKKKAASVKTETSKKKATSKKASTKTTDEKTETKKTSKKAEKIALYAKDIKKHYGKVDSDFLEIIVKNLGPSIYKKDAELVSCSDPKELNTVRKNFLMKKLGIDASQKVLDAAIQDVCEELKATRTKYRATFYYSLAKKFKKESVLS